MASIIKPLAPYIFGSLSTIQMSLSYASSTVFHLLLKVTITQSLVLGFYVFLRLQLSHPTPWLQLSFHTY